MGKPKPQKSRSFRILDYPLFDMARIVAMVHAHIVDRTPGDLNPSKWRVIAHLGEQDVLTINELAALAVLERSALSRVVESLDHDGIVRRRRNSLDSRAVDVSLTPSGRHLYAQCTVIAKSEIERALAVLNTAERQKLTEYLARVRENMMSSSPESQHGHRTAE